MLREVMLAWTGSGIALVDADIHIGVESSEAHSTSALNLDVEIQRPYLIAIQEIQYESRIALTTVFRDS